MNEEEDLKYIAERKNMTIEEVKKYREYSSRSLNSEEWLEYLKLCEKAFDNSSKYIYIYEHEIKEINKGINNLQQERDKYKSIVDKTKKYLEENIEWTTKQAKLNDRFPYTAEQNRCFGLVEERKCILRKIKELEEGVDSEIK